MIGTEGESRAEVRDGRGRVEPHLELASPVDGAAPRAVALVLPGGKASSYGAVEPGQLAVRRMRPFARAIARRGDDLAVASLRYRYRGWNDPHAHPVEDVGFALARIEAELGPVPVVLVGHSLGGRAALRAAGDPRVRGVVALAPWLPDGEPVDQLAARDVVILHGTRDVTTSARASSRFAARARGVATRVVCLQVPRSGHGMLLRAGLWHRLAADATLAVAAGAPFDALVRDAAGSGCRACPTPGDPAPGPAA